MSDFVAFTNRSIIAEIGSVHDGSFGNACRLIEVAARCGADVVKFQTHIAEAETLPDAPTPPYFNGESRLDYFRRTAFGRDQWRALRDHAASRGVGFLSSPFSLEAIDLLEEIGVEGYKVPSGEVSNIPLMERLAETGKPVLLSSGMSDWAEFDRALAALRQGRGAVTLMQCTSMYPCPPEHYGLNVIAEMAERYHLPVGYSDHSDGPAAPIAAATLGATVIEKHLTFSREMYGSDAANAMEPDAFAAMAAGIRAVWTALDHPVDKDDLAPFAEMKRIFEKSIVTARTVKAGDALSRADIAFKKPGDGIPAWRYGDVLGRRASRDLPADHKITQEDMA